MFQVIQLTQSLVKNDQKQIAYFEEALLFNTKKNLHAIFATLLIYRQITNISAIWNKFAIDFYDNLPY